jgi:hypothetical protein
MENLLSLYIYELLLTMCLASAVPIALGPTFFQLLLGNHGDADVLGGDDEGKRLTNMRRGAAFG